MPKQFKYVSSSTIISKVIRDLGVTDINKSDMIEWIGEAIQAIGTNGMKEESVMFLEIANHVADLPSEVSEVVKVYRNHKYDIGDCVLPLEAAVEDEHPVEIHDVTCGCDIIPDEDLPRWTRRFERRWEYLDWDVSPLRTNRFTPIALSSAILFSGVTCEAINEGLSACSGDEYQLQNGVIKTNFPTGQVAIAYRHTPLDSEGYPMIPDLYSVQAAITHYISYKLFARMWYQGREGMSDKMQWADREYQFYVKQAKNDTWMLYGIDEHQNMINFRKSAFSRPTFDNLGRPSNIYPKGLR